MNKLYLFLLVVSFNFGLKAQLSAVYGKADYNFWIHLPEDTILKSKPPVLIFLHGRSLSGTDLNKVKKYGVIHEMEKKGRKIPAIVVAPQVASGPWIPEKILSVLNYVQKNYDIDSNRVYICGMSLGGYGTMDFAGKYPDKVAAAVALCGGGNVKDASNLAKVPLWIQHGDQDAAVPISESDKIVEAIKKYDASNLIYTILKGANHGDLEKIFRTDEMYNWLFSKIKD